MRRVPPDARTGCTRRSRACWRARTLRCSTGCWPGASATRRGGRRRCATPASCSTSWAWSRASRPPPRAGWRRSSAASRVRARARRTQDCQQLCSRSVSLTLALVGDVNCKADEGCEPALAPSVVERLAEAEVCIGNLEGVLADARVELHYKAGWFDCEPEMLRVVRSEEHTSE